MSRSPREVESSSPVEVDYLGPCKSNASTIADLVKGGNLLNYRQCKDLSSKLLETTFNIGELVLHCGAPIVCFQLALESVHRNLEKAKLLVRNCAEEDWCAAAVFQCQNENAFREILLDVGLCYNAVYELAKSQSKEGNALPEDLRQSSVFDPATDSDVLQDKQGLQQMLDELASGHTNLKGLDYWIPGRVARKQSLAKYLLVKMHCTSLQPQAKILDTYSAILWTKASEPSGTWGRSRFLGAGSGASGVVRTSWLGIPCAKKEFHGQESERSFRKEAGILAHLKHPSIVNFICCGNGLERGDRFIAMELMETSLFDMIEERRRKGEHFSVAVALDMMVQMARGVRYLHGQGVAHRDLKPQNVVVNRMSAPQVVDAFRVKLVDFGVSKTEVAVSRSNTMTYQGIGTTMYRAPEAHPKANPDGVGKVNWFKADAFSFAMTCAHLLSLDTPFTDTKPGELYNKITKKSKRPEVPDIYPEDLVVVVKDCWNTNPRPRPSFAKICFRLEAFRHKFMRGDSAMNEELTEDKVAFHEGFDFIRTKLDPSTKSPQDEKLEGETFADIVAAIPCSCGRALELLPQLPYINRGCTCNICWKEIDGNMYHCETCQFDAHSDCAVIKDEVNASFHDHILHLLVQNYYCDKPDAICCFCEESLQNSEWVYRCERCDFDVHALCTKFPRERTARTVHPHPLSMIQCPPRKSLACTRCNNGVKEHTWRYTCGQQSCEIELHPLCAIRPWNPLCMFNTSHRLRCRRKQRSFYCIACGAPGFSWSYHCRSCDVDVHPDCVDYADEGGGDWSKDYEKLMMENGSKDDRTKMNMLSELVDKLATGDALDWRSSSKSRSPRVMTRVEPAIQRIAGTGDTGLDASKDVNIRRQIAAETAARIKGKKLARKEARQRLRVNLVAMLENVERVVLDLQSPGNMSRGDAEVLAATHEKLKSRQDLVKEEIAMQLEAKMSRGPGIAVFFQNRMKNGKRVGREMLTSLRADMQNVGFVLLCEEAGHEHVVSGYGMLLSRLGEKMAKGFQPLHACGLQVVRRVMSTLEPHELSGLESVTIPCMESYISWDLRAIDLEEYGNQSSDLTCKEIEKVKAVKQATDSAAEWVRNYLDCSGHGLLKSYGILKTFGLQRVRYKVGEGGDNRKYRRGSLAWLCTKHVKSGLKHGTLESYPLKYHNVEVDYQLRFLRLGFTE